MEKKLRFLLFLVLFAFVIQSSAQQIPASTRAAGICSTCAPDGWTPGSGTPDVSNSTIAATTSTAGGGANWTNTPGGTASVPLPAPPNGHSTWITIRDIGTVAGEEDIYTTMTGLFVGREYEITIYSLTAVTRENGGTGGNLPYAGAYIDQFDFVVGTLPRVSVTDVSRNVWGTNKLRFTATTPSMQLRFYPGFNSPANGSTALAGMRLMESVNISVTINAINTIPIAKNKNTTTPMGTPVGIDVIDGAIDYDGIIIPGSVDLNPFSPGQQTSITNADGTWTVNSSGVVTFTPAPGFRGEATLEYTVEDDYALDGVSAPGISTPKTITVVVDAPVIEATSDTPLPINGKDGGDTPSVLDNDTLNGDPVVPSEVTLTPGTPVDGDDTPTDKLTMSPDGTISVDPETPAGTYEFPYTICEVLNPANCATAVVTILVEAAPIAANNDTPLPINGKDGSTTPSVLDNDELNGVPVIPDEVTLTWSPDNVENPNITLNTDGTITVLPETPEGTYEFEYRICEVLNPTNCDEATVTIVIEPAPIVAENDHLQIEWDRPSIVTESVLHNDSFNGNVIDLNEVRLTPGIPSDPNLSMNADGTINIAASTRPGTYTYPYTICEVLNPNNCSSAVATIVIQASNLFIPNVITPNGDGKNDCFEIIGSENYDRVELIIVNRWGNEVFSNDNYDNNWTGGGLNEGTYYYIIKLVKGDKIEQFKGWILIKMQ